MRHGGGGGGWGRRRNQQPRAEEGRRVPSPSSSSPLPRSVAPSSVESATSPPLFAAPPPLQENWAEALTSSSFRRQLSEARRGEGRARRAALPGLGPRWLRRRVSEGCSGLSEITGGGRARGAPARSSHGSRFASGKCLGRTRRLPACLPLWGAFWRRFRCLPLPQLGGGRARGRISRSHFLPPLPQESSGNSWVNSVNHPWLWQSWRNLSLALPLAGCAGVAFLSRCQSWSEPEAPGTLTRVLPVRGGAEALAPTAV